MFPAQLCSREVFGEGAFTNGCKACSSCCNGSHVNSEQNREGGEYHIEQHG